VAAVLSGIKNMINQSLNTSQYLKLTPPTTQIFSVPAYFLYQRLFCFEVNQARNSAERVESYP
jgi:hypothetical protein